MPVQSTNKMEEVNDFVDRLEAVAAQKIATSQHLWTMMAMYAVDPTVVGRQLLDSEHLITVQGPGCFLCEKQYSPEIDAEVCIPIGMEESL